MKNRTRLVYNCFAPDHDGDHDDPFTVTTFRKAKRLVKKWGLDETWGGGSIVRVLRHRHVSLASACFVLRDPARFDLRLVSRRRRPHPQGSSEPVAATTARTFAVSGP